MCMIIILCVLGIICIQFAASIDPVPFLPPFPNAYPAVDLTVFRRANAKCGTSCSDMGSAMCCGNKATCALDGAGNVACCPSSKSTYPYLMDATRNVSYVLRSNACIELAHILLLITLLPRSGYADSDLYNIQMPFAQGPFQPLVVQRRHLLSLVLLPLQRHPQPYHTR